MIWLSLLSVLQRPQRLDNYAEPESVSRYLGREEQIVLAEFAKKVNYIREFYFLFASTGNQRACLARKMVM